MTAQQPTPQHLRQLRQPQFTEFLSKQPQPQQILLVGAYERDNFGDVLFGILTKHLLEARGHSVVLASVVMADMRHIFDEIVLPYRYALTQNSWDVVWVVGGEVAGSTVDKALSMTLPQQPFKHFTALTQHGHDTALREVLGAPGPKDVAYVPRLASYERNRKATLIINSSGGFRARGRAARIMASTETVHVSTRDPVSHRALEEIDVASRALAPDLVHMIPELLPPPQRKQNRILFQASAQHLSQGSLEAVIAQLCDLGQDNNAEIILFAAGYAPHHDSFEKYQQIKAGIEARAPHIRVEIPSVRHPLELVGIIASATLWLGSSLHGRIIAAAYDIPRVSFAKPKLNRYISHWDPQMPYGVSLSQMRDQAAEALNAPKSTASQGRALSTAAQRNLEWLIDLAESAPARAEHITPAEVERHALLHSYEMSLGLVEAMGELSRQVHVKTRRNRKLRRENATLRQQQGE